jgi:Fe2+ transport system protein FeoA
MAQVKDALIPAVAPEEFIDTCARVGKVPGEVSVDALCAGQQARVLQMPQDSLLHCLGLRQGRSLRVIARQRFGGPVVVELDGRCVALGRSIARTISVTDTM